MNKKILLFSLIALVAVGAIGVAGINMVSAYGWFGWGMVKLDPQEVVDRQNQMFSSQADLLGISVDKVKEYWAQGKNMPEIIQDLGISQEDWQAKMKTAREEQMKKELQILVENGVITQEQADSRLQAMQDRMVNGKFGRGMGRGFMRGFGCRCQDSQ